jgi:hypothetical protein
MEFNCSDVSVHGLGTTVSVRHCAVRAPAEAMYCWSTASVETRSDAVRETPKSTFFSEAHTKGINLFYVNRGAFF